ncbi:MAG: hypothetical protein LCH56_04525 [Proteobacteria bacterium]|nr:hypothetical protein [Pseudomonadota bacterium]
MRRVLFAFGTLIALTGAAAGAETVTISTADCRKLVAHQPRPDVTYQGGVDVRGNAVVPADLNGTGAIDLPASIEIPLTVDTLQRLRGAAPQSGDILASRRGLEGKAALGTLTIKGDAVFWNGKQIQSQDEVLMAEACKSSLRARGIVLPESKPGNPPPP